ncbi:unnamed protein product, partial [Ilex paraguariensis]
MVAQVVNSGEPTTEPWFKPKKGSVIPAKRRSVKKMMLDTIVQSVACLFRSSSSLCSSGIPLSENCGSSNMISPDTASKAKTDENKKTMMKKKEKKPSHK